MTRRRGPSIHPDFLFQGNSPNSGIQVETFPYREIDTDIDPLASGVMLSAAIAFQTGDVISNITFKSGATATGTPLNQVAALYSNAATPALLAQSTDVTTQAWAANTAITFALESEVLISEAGIYYVAFFAVASDHVSLLGRSVALASAADGILAAHKVLAEDSGSSLTDTAPATITSGTTVATIPYAVCT